LKSFSVLEICKISMHKKCLHAFLHVLRRGSARCCEILLLMLHRGLVV